MTDFDFFYDSHPSMFKNNPILFVLSVLLVPVGIGVIVLFIWWLQVKGTRITIDKKKTLLRKGILSKQINEVYHQDVRNTKVSQSFFQRMFDVGTLSVSSAGQGDMEVSVAGIPDPYRAKKIINDNRNNRKKVKDKSSESSNISTADELQKLANLKENGVLTKSEFQEQKKKILERS